MTKYTGMVKQKEREEFTEKQFKGIMIIMNICLLIAVFFAGISVGMSINTAIYQKKTVKNPIRDLHYVEHYNTQVK